MWQRQADWTWTLIRRIHLGARRPANWAQLFQFGVVGAAGYVVNLAVFTVLTLALDVQHIAAAVLAFCVAVSNNFIWNRIWTFRESAEGGHAGFQATRFFAVSLGGLAVNLAVLALLVDVLGRPTSPRRRSRSRSRLRSTSSATSCGRSRGPRHAPAGSAPPR